MTPLSRYAYLLFTVVLAVPVVGEVPFRHEVIDKSPDFTRSAKAVGDIDGDGFKDIVVGGTTGLYWYKYPQWTKYTIEATKVTDEFVYCVDMQVGDIDGDGDLDVIVGEYKSSKQVRWYENPGPKAVSAPWKSHVLYSFKWPYNHDVELGDINRDGKMDVLLRGPTGETVLLFQNTPDDWTPRTISKEPGEGTALVDLDGDGDLDVVHSGFWLECPADPLTGTWTKHGFAEGWPNRVTVVVVDLNRDGRPDVVLAPAESADRLSWLEAPANPRTGGWKEHVVCEKVDFVHTLRVGDVNGDGAPDIFFGEMHQSVNKRVGFFLNQGDSKSWTLQVLGTNGTHNGRLADMDNDGDLDVVGANWSTWLPPLPRTPRVQTSENPVEWWENLSAQKSTGGAREGAPKKIP